MIISVFVKPSLNLNMLVLENERINISRTSLVINEYDKNAVEEGVRIKEKFGGKLIIFSALTWGPIEKKMQDFERILRECLAMGVDEAHAIIDEKIINATSLETTKAIASLVKKIGNFDILITGESSMDTSSFQFAPRLASILNLPIITFAKKINIEGNKILVERDIEDKIQIIESELPCILSVTGEINQPRVPTIKQILQAKSKPLLKYKLSDLGIDISPTKILEEIRIIQVKRKNIFLEGNLEEIAEKLTNILKEEKIL
jgi:electron transfer flavoprotein beta subunit